MVTTVLRWVEAEHHIKANLSSTFQLSAVIVSNSRKHLVFSWEISYQVGYLAVLLLPFFLNGCYINPIAFAVVSQRCLPSA